MALDRDVRDLRRWIAETPPEARTWAEWEADYPAWGLLHTSAVEFALSRPVAAWTHKELDDFLYALARDNEYEAISEGVSADAQTLIALCEAAIRQGERDAKWQLAARLGAITRHRDRAIDLLLEFSADPDEYVRRRALMALSKLGAPQAEELAERAWHTGLEYQRIAALHCLSEIGSGKLPAYVAEAKADGRKFVLQAADRALLGRDA